MPYKTFTANILLSDDVNDYLMNQSVIVFDDATDRDSALPLPPEGATAYLKDSGKIFVYDGSAWVMVVSVTTPPGLVLLKTQTIGNAVGSVEVTDAFSADYENYRITVTGGVASITLSMNLTLGSTTTGYYGGLQYVVYGTGATSSSNDNNAAQWTWGGQGSTNTLMADVELFSPFATKRTAVKSSFLQTVTGGGGGVYNGFLNDNTSYTSFKFTTPGQTMTGGTIRVYGYRN